MSIEGKGFYIWKIHRCEDGDPVAITRRALDAGLAHVLVKIADGPSAYNVDLAAPVVESLKAAGISVWGWQFAYGNEPFGEADIAIHRIRTLGLDGFVVNAEGPYKGKHAAASAYMERLRQKLGEKLPIALSSFRYPHLHPELPWTEFLSYCTYNMPQVYWVQANNPAEQLDRSIAQFRTIYPIVPIIATGSAYEEFGWRPTPVQVQAFLQRAYDLGLPAANFWSWDYAGSNAGRDFWNVIATFDWQPATPRRDIVDTLLDAMNAGDIEAATSLYHKNAVLVTSQHTYHGQPRIREHYIDLLKHQLPGARFTLDTRVNEGAIRHIQWDARGSQNGNQVLDALDTLGIRQAKFQYHSRVYRISNP